VNLPRAVPIVAVLASLIVLVLYGLRQKPAAASFPHTFEKSEEGWIPFGQHAKVRITHEAAHVKEGKGALALDYEVIPGQFGSAVLPIGDGLPRAMKRLSFWLKSDVATTIAVVLSEKKPDGGDYAAWFWSPKDVWQEIELTPSDFTLNEGPDDPKDSNGRLDLDRVQGVGLIDLAQYFLLLGKDPRFPLAVNELSGTHSLYVDDFEVLAEARAARSSASPTVIGDLRRNFLTWLTLGGAELSLNKSDNPLGKPAFEASYEQRPGRYVVISHGLSNLDLQKAERFSLSIASAKEAHLMLYLEERRPGSHEGPRYNLMLEVPGNRQPQNKTLAFSDFTPDATAPADPNGRLDPGKLKSISLIDITAALTTRTEKNTIWLADVEALAP
jgi:hypothetical protein